MLVSRAVPWYTMVYLFQGPEAPARGSELFLVNGVAQMLHRLKHCERKGLDINPVLDVFLATRQNKHPTLLCHYLFSKNPETILDWHQG